MHEKWMALAIEEAKKGLGLTSPNPAVGAVIVKDDTVIGRGFHKKAGCPHAEREAIAHAKAQGKTKQMLGASIYVTLEPCSTTGQTPPCTQGIIESGITSVIYGSTDPNPAHQGGADAQLKAQGIHVTSGILETECDALIRGFSKRITTNKPLVIAKTAMSLDGKITRPPGESQWFTSPESREKVHQIRSEVDAIIVGGRTLRKDNPSLTIRGKHFRKDKIQPYRAIITHSDRSKLPKELAVFTDEYKERTQVYTDTPFDEILTDLADKGCNTVLLECGGGLMGQWFEQHLVDECYFFLAPLITGGSDLAVGGQGATSYETSVQLTNLSYTKIGNDVLAHGVVAP